MSGGPMARIVGSGRYIPEREVTNEELARMMDTSDAWIQSRTGIKKRHYIQSGQTTSSLAFHASTKALDQAGLRPDQIDLIIFATLSPDYFFPGCGVLLGAFLEIPGTPALDVRNQCSGFLYGLQCAEAMIRSRIHSRILLVGAEVHSTGLDFTSRGRAISVLFGDGAGAWVLEASEPGQSTYPSGVIRTELGADGRYAKSLWCMAPASGQHPSRITPENLVRGEHYPQMNGRHVFKKAVTTMRDAVLALIASCDMTLDDVDLFIPHQANARISEMVRRSLGVEKSRFFSNIERYGNTTAASVPIAVDECISRGVLKTGQLLCCVAFGSGYTWGASLIRY